MPWKVVPKSGKFCVVKSDSGETVKCHGTKAKAEKHKRALYANVHSSLAMEPYLGDDGLWHTDNVPIVETGLLYPASTGLVTFTQEDLESAVEALSDTAIQDPRVKLGHTSEYNNELIGDAEPAFGRVENLRLSDDHQIIYGDYVGTPEWLTMVMPVAYPSRSVETAHNVETVTGKKYAMVITDVSLLGVRWPGCTVLQDLPLWYGPEIPVGVEIDAGGEDDMKFPGKKTAASVDTVTVRRKFYNEFATTAEGRGSWWIRGEQVEGGGVNLIVDDEEEGEIYKVPVNVGANDEVEFGDPVLVKIEYPEKTAASRAAVVQGMAINHEEMTVFASRADSSPEEPTTQEGASMDEETRSAMATRLGLPEDATEEQIDAEIARLKAAAPASQETPAPEDDTSGQGGAPGAGADDFGHSGPPSGEKPAPYPPTSGGPATTPPEYDQAGHVLVDKETWEQTKAGAELAVQHDRARRTEERDRILNEAQAAGKFMPSRRKHYETLFDSDFDGAKHLLTASVEEGGLAAGTIPLEARGASGSTTEGVQAGNGQSEGLPSEWFPELSRPRNRGPVTQAKEG